MSEDTLVKQALGTLLQLGPENSEWLGTVKLLLSTLGLHCHFQNTKLVNTGRFTEIVKNRLKYHFVELWHVHVSGAQLGQNESSKLRFYKLLKNAFEKEPYLDLIPNFHMRKIITKFRCSDHVLEIEKGRHKNKKVEERLCKMCNRSIEDEIHFLNNCNKYSVIRFHYFGGVPGTYNWLQIMQCKEREIAFKLGNYLTKAFKLRKKIIN